MEFNKIQNTNIKSLNHLITPTKLIEELPSLEYGYKIFSNREIISNIILKKDPRLLFIVGPCSVHNIEETKEYGVKLASLAKKVEDKIFSKSLFNRIIWFFGKNKFNEIKN